MKIKDKALVALILIVVILVTIISGFFVFNTDNYIIVRDSQFLCVDGEFTKNKISNSDDAIHEVQAFCSKNGLTNVAEELSIKSENIVGETTYYRLQQNYHNIPVYGRAFVVIKDNDGNAIGFTGNGIEISNVNTEPTIQTEDIHSIVNNYLEKDLKCEISTLSTTVGDDSLVIYTLEDENKYNLAYKVYTNVNGTAFELIIDAHDSTVLRCENLMRTGSAQCIVAENNTTFDGYFDEKNNVYRMYDEKRNIYILSAENTNLRESGNTQTLIISEENNVFGDTTREKSLQMVKAESLLTAVQKSYDFFEHIFSDSVVGSTLAYYNDFYDSGNNAWAGIIDSVSEGVGNNNGLLKDGITSGVVAIGSNYNYDEVDLIAHEYTHNVEKNISSMNYTGESGAIMEGYSDIFGEIIESWNAEDGTFNICDWKNVYRNIKDPLKSNNPTSKNGTNWKTTKEIVVGYDSDWNKVTNDNGNVHNNSTVVSYAAYLMTIGVNGSYTNISMKELSELWYSTMLTLPSNCTFDVLRNNMEMVASNKNIGLSKQQKACILAAFDEVGITGTSIEVVSNNINIIVIDNHRNSYDDYTVLVSGDEYTDLFKLGWSKQSFKQTYTDTNKIQLKNGEYTIRIIDNNNDSNTVTRQIKVKNNGKTNELTFMLPEDVSDITVDNPSSETSEVNVIDAVNYKKGIIVVPEMEAMGWDAGVDKHIIKIPKLVGNTQSIAEFNEKIYNNHKNNYEKLLADEERNQIFRCDYQYKIYENLVSIAVTYSHAAQGGGGNSYYKAYYFNISKDKEISFDEYLKELDLERNILLSQIKATDDFIEQEWHYANGRNVLLNDCLLDENGTTAFFEDIETMDGWSEFRTESLIQ